MKRQVSDITRQPDHGSSGMEMGNGELDVASKVTWRSFGEEEIKAYGQSCSQLKRTQDCREQSEIELLKPDVLHSKPK